MIQTINTDKLDLIAPLWEELNSLHRELDDLCEKERRKTTWVQRRKELLKKAIDQQSLIQVVKEGNHLVGYCFTSIDETNKGEVDSLFLKYETRGKGYGKKLMENSLRWLADSRCNDIEISVHPGNTDAIMFYWKFGFVTNPTMKKVANKPINTDGK